MRKPFRLIGTMLMALLIVLGLQAPAMASPGTVKLCVNSISATAMKIKMQNGFVYGVQPGQCIGEGTSLVPNYEPQSILIETGWTVRWKIGATGAYTVDSACGTRTQYYRNVHPGSSFTGTWSIFTQKDFRC